MNATPEDELRTSIVWPMQVRTTEARRAWRFAVYDAGFALTHASERYGLPRKGALSAPRWVNHVLAAVELSMPRSEGLAVVEKATRVLRDPDLCLAVRVAWALGGIVAAAGVVKRDAYPLAQGEPYDETR